MNETQNNEQSERNDTTRTSSAAPVEHWLASGKSAKAVAAELGITGQTLLV